LLLQSAISPLIIKYVEIQDDQTLIEVDSYEAELNASYRPSTELFAQIDQMLRRNKLAYTDIDEIYVASGPGSYTGARLLVTIVKTIVFMVPKIRVFDASLLNILLQASTRENHTDLCNYGIVPARKNKYYVRRQVDGASHGDALFSTTEMIMLIDSNVPCFVNGVRIDDGFDENMLKATLDIRDWIKVSKEVADVDVYEPYYLEQVNIG